MKKILSVLLVLCMLALVAISFSACGKVDEKKATKDPGGVLTTAFDTALSSFFSDGTDLKKIQEKASEKGSYHLILASDNLGDGKLYEIDETLYIDRKGEAFVSESKVTSAGTVYRASIWGDKESLALKSESLFGNKDTLYINFNSFLKNFEESDLRAALGVDEETTQYILEIAAHLVQVLDGTDPIIPVDHRKDLMDDLYEILGQTIAEKDIAIGDGKKADHIILSYTIDNDTIAALFDFCADVIRDYELPGDEDIEEYVAMTDELVDALNASGKLEIACAFYINARSGAMAQTDVEITFTPTATTSAYTTDVEDESDVVDLAFTMIFGEDRLTLEGTLDADGSSYQITAEATKKTKSGKTTYTFVADAQRGNVRIDLLEMTCNFDEKKGAIEMTGFVAVDEYDRMTIDMAATCETSKTEYVLSLESLLIRNGKEDVFDFKKSRNNEVSLTVSVIENLPERDVDAEDIMDMTTADWSQLISDMEKSDIGKLLGSMQELPEDEEMG